MDQIHCSICTKTNHIPEGQLVIVATFAHKYQAENTIAAMEKSHIVSSWSGLFEQGEILDKNIMGAHALVLELHGIKDIIQLQSLYIESMCQDNDSLTVNVLSTKQSCKTFLSQVA